MKCLNLIINSIKSYFLNGIFHAREIEPMASRQYAVFQKKISNDIHQMSVFSSVVAPFVSNFISISQFIARNLNDKELNKKKRAEKRERENENNIDSICIIQRTKARQYFLCCSTLNKLFLELAFSMRFAIVEVPYKPI